MQTENNWPKSQSCKERIVRAAAEWYCWSGEKEWKEEVQQVIIEKTKTPLSRAWQHPLHQVPPQSLPPSSPSNSIQTREFPPPHHPPIIHLSLHSSRFSPTNGNNNTQQHNNQQFADPPFSNLTSKSRLLRMTGLLIRPLKSLPMVERDTSESRKECNWQVLVWSRHPVCQQIPRGAGQQSRRLR